MDISLYYKEIENGMLFILLHGNSEDGNYFKSQIDFFSNSYRVIVVDTRKHGRSFYKRATLICFLYNYCL